WLIRLLILGSGYNTMISHLGLIRTFPNLCRRSDFTLKNSAGGICRDYHRRYHRVEICTLRKQDRLHVARANRLSWGNFCIDDVSINYHK
ncbi:hypothetical protein, partial [Enterobacter asburiae]|uniref:hypothetical protein n=1 Tax=Enterobacter asburiae TaxID=61645 RepID=UPI0029352ABD